MRLRCDAILIL